VLVAKDDAHSRWDDVIGALGALVKRSLVMSRVQLYRILLGHFNYEPFEERTSALNLDTPVGTRVGVAVAENGGALLDGGAKRGSETTGHAGGDRNLHSSPKHHRGGLGGSRMQAGGRAGLASRRTSRGTAHADGYPSYAPWGQDSDCLLWKILR
jgi:hypothetical protein